MIPRNRASLVSYSPLKEEEGEGEAEKEEEGAAKLANVQSEERPRDDSAGVRTDDDRQVRGRRKAIVL